MNLQQSPLVSVQWLSENFSSVKIIESKLRPIGASDNWETGEKLPGAVLMDIEEDFSDKNSDLPHTLQNEADFQKAARKLGINTEDVIVIYDQVGVYSSPRAWWMLRVMGHDNVFVLDGGISAWKSAANKTDSAHWEFPDNGDFVAKFNPDLFFDTDNILRNLYNQDLQIIDARSAGRFTGEAPEPRPGMRGGHMPNANNLPFDKILNGTHFKSVEELRVIFSDLAAENQKLVMTCGSGVTASILALGATLAGYKSVAVYDGSWSEWGRPGELPVVK